ncbi:undecaprenyl-phosphate alpha-N-acetylglucosaminyl 1-phosphate transferase [Candidatus Epulonipiscium fishelsonii]|uniref:Undecaprenyl-phosphate alpha-N-acetylglucosaminyl 1-phosphate transferase n=1 Tax=Candidatus Epulonipiscium fishelsonii TaxID=77094 RepID=A0ACC8XJ93_9FIRM|nr:undecaprenyl-phosphate alpha-N-acetylglucosaminyl 1-phosphate transferase [Epulopiscium sp. SCG-D08WGA-EpuloA1]
MNLLGLYVVAFGVSFLIAFFSTPIAKKIAFKFGAIAQPRLRDMHTQPIPRMGGIAIFASFIFTLIVLYKQFEFLHTRQIFGIVLGGSLIALLGFFDDICELNSKFKMAIQVIASIIVIRCGIRIDFIAIPFIEDLKFLSVFSVPITILWIVGITNAVNLIDGLDGLAAGVSSIASICLMVLAIYSGHPIAVFLTVILTGATLGFLPYNFNPASIFMGDTGSTFLGFMLSIVSILGLLKTYTISTILVAILVLGLPIFDTTFAIIRRLLAGKPIMSPDRGHLHHRLVDSGYSHKGAVVTLYGISGVFGLSGIGLLMHDSRMIAIIIVIIAILLYFNTKNNKHRQID